MLAHVGESSRRPAWRPVYQQGSTRLSEVFCSPWKTYLRSGPRRSAGRRSSAVSLLPFWRRSSTRRLTSSTSEESLAPLTFRFDHKAHFKAYFHYGCALRYVALRGERYRDADNVSISLDCHATQRAAVMEMLLKCYRNVALPVLAVTKKADPNAYDVRYSC